MIKNMLNKSIYIYIGLLASLIVSGCERDLESENISRLTNHADIKLNGDDVQIVDLGVPYTDPGAVATEGGKEIELQIEGEVDVNTAGIYTLTYSATNSDGFSNSISRLVAVTPKLSDEVKAVDLSGKYERNGVFTEIEKVADGLYFIGNVAGVAPPGAVVGVYFLHTELTTIDVPRQPATVSASETIMIQAVNEKISLTNGVSFSWQVREDVLKYFNQNTVRAFKKVENPPVRYE
jgi:hypothetical protein